MKEILVRRNIEYLFHFTRIENLESICINGLIHRDDLDKNNNITSFVNDNYRYDGCKNANCLSVEFPNYKMFYRICCDNPETNWVVLALDAELIIDFNCAFCYSNAGSEEIYSIPLEERMGAEAFEDIFAERNGYPSREILGIPDCCPTNPQAEILVFGNIPISYIKYAIFRNENILKKYKNFVPSNIKCIVNPDFFYARLDYKHWRQ